MAAGFWLLAPWLGVVVLGLTILASGTLMEMTLKKGANNDGTR
jgi:hypothetical protein